MMADSARLSDDTEHEMRLAIQDAVAAERRAEPMSNGNRYHAEVSKNTHFEFKFTGDHPPVYVYLERYDSEPGIEILLWVDRSWFDGQPGDYETKPSDADGGLGVFADKVRDLVADELDVDTQPTYEFHQNVKWSVVFQTVFYLDLDKEDSQSAVAEGGA